MPKRLPRALMPALLLWMTGCAYVGAPLPPALNVPAAVQDLVAVEYGQNLLVRFTIPEFTTDPLPIGELRAVELFIGPDPQPGASSFDRENWAAASERFEVDQLVPGPVEFTTAAAPFVGQQVIFGVRLTGRTGRFSDWSNYDTLTVYDPLPAPRNVTARAVPEGVELLWEASSADAQYRVMRGVGDEAQFRTLADSIGGTQFLDQGTAYGIEYRYMVVAVAHQLQQSLPSNLAILTPLDEFAPAIPAGLSAVPGVDTIELAWARNTDPDFRSYSVYRATGDGAFTALATGIGAPAFSDSSVQTGMRYRYAVSAVDEVGNESQRSDVIEAVVP